MVLRNALTGVLLSDDHEILREGLEELINRRPAMQVTTSVNNGRAAVELAIETHPDVVVMDIAMPDLNGIDATRQIVASASTAKVLCLSMHKEEEMIRSMLQAGASGYLVKDCAGHELVDAIRAVAEGRIYVSPAIAVEVVQGYLSGRPGPRAASTRC
jgi:DNA-binding NarL/FixJ family response regulator